MTGRSSGRAPISVISRRKGGWFWPRRASRARRRQVIPDGNQVGGVRGRGDGGGGQARGGEAAPHARLSHHRRVQQDGRAGAGEAAAAPQVQGGGGSRGGAG